MRNRYSVAVVIPAYNEETAIGSVLAHIPSWVDDIVVVDNGSTDSTARIAQEHGARVIQEFRRGYGAACLAGIAALKKCDIVVFLDADYSDRPEEMHLLVDPIAHHKADMVIGSRVAGRCEPGALTPQARIGNWFACWLTNMFWKTHYTDLGPFRAIRYSALTSLNMQDKNYGWTIEMQIKAAQRRMQIQEVPVQYRKRVGASKISGTMKGIIGAGTKILGIILREALRRQPITSNAEKIVIFTRYPEPGTTKTRLIPVLGREGAAHLQRRMTEDTIARVHTLKTKTPYTIEIRYDGGSEKLMRNWLGNGVEYHFQVGRDLGERLQRAFTKSFNDGAERVVIIGSDSPDIPLTFLQRALDALAACDCVVGPAPDGGYYLIGFRKRGFFTDIFHNINWGTSSVFAETLNIIKNTHHTFHLLPLWYDIDTISDLKYFAQRNKRDKHSASKTSAFIETQWMNDV